LKHKNLRKGVLMKNVSDLVELHGCISEGYFAVMRKYGLESYSTEPLIPKDDDSILFTNSTIVPLKGKFLSGDYSGNGYFLLQDCLRLASIKTVEDEESVLKHVSCFKMLGSLVPSCHLDLAINAALEFLVDVVGIKSKDLIVLIPSGSEFWHEIFSAQNIFTQEVEAYEWKYGIAGVKGLGMAFAIRLANGTVGRLGNFVAMYQDGKLSAYEFGFGLETLIGRAILAGNPFSGSIQFAVTGLPDNQESYKISNLVGIISAMFVAGVNKKEFRSRWFLLTRSLRILTMIAIRNQIKSEELISWIRNFSIYFFGREDIVDCFASQLLLRWDQISNAQSRFANWLNSQQQLYRSRGMEVLRFTDRESVLRYAEEQYFLSRETTLSLLSQYEPWR